MSGHSKWANIKARKGSQDAKRSATFTRLAKNILTAVREGGGLVDANLNSKLRTAIEQARVANMPKENIERLLSSFVEKREHMLPMVLEGFGPAKVPLIVTAETDNKNRTLSEIKLIFRDYGGNLGESGSVAFLFEHLGEIKLEDNLSEEDQLKLIDFGAIDIRGQYVYTSPENLGVFANKIKEYGLISESCGLIYRALNPLDVPDSEQDKLLEFLEKLEENEDVLGVYPAICDE